MSDVITVPTSGKQGVILPLFQTIQMIMPSQINNEACSLNLFIFVLS